MNKTKKVIKITGYVTTFSILILIIFGLFNATLFKLTISEMLLTGGLFAIALSAFILDLIPQSISAHMVILLTYLLKINSNLSMAIILISAGISSWFGFWLGRNVEQDFFEDLIGKKVYSKVDKTMDKYGHWYVFVSAISPLPYIPILFGGLGMEWKKFLVWGLIPRLMGFLVTAFFAEQIIIVLGL